MPRGHARRLGLAALLGAACDAGPSAPTQVVVRVEADLGLRGVLSSLRVRTNAEDDGAWDARSDRNFGADVLHWPVDFVVVPAARSGRADHVFEVVVAALDADGGRLVEARAISQFTLHQQRVLTLRLDLCGKPLYAVCEADPDCRGAACQTCAGGECVSTPFTLPSELPRFDGGGAVDLAADTGPNDGGVEGAITTGTNADGGPERDAGEAPGNDAGAQTDAAQCGIGFMPAGAACVDIDECLGSNVCTDVYVCRNRASDYYCRGLFPEQPLADVPQFVLVGSGLVRDTTTGLEWQVDLPHDTPGAPPVYAGCTGSGAGGADRGTRCTQAEAAQYCAQSPSPWGGSGWRLPTITELLSIVDDKRAAPAFALETFPGTPADDYFWSSSGVPGESAFWLVDTSDGSTVHLDGFFTWSVRCVRGEGA